jgi:hypothetical protein
MGPGYEALGEITAEHLARFFANLAGGGLKVAAPVSFLGELVTTPGILTLLADEHANPAELLACHQRGYWGKWCPRCPLQTHLCVIAVGKVRMVSSKYSVLCKA